jgi:outer membrane protein TolC
LTDLVRIEIEIEQLYQERIALIYENKQARVKFAALGSKQDSTLVDVSGEMNNELAIPDLASLLKTGEENPALTAYAIEQSRLETERKQRRAEVTPDLNLSAGIFAIMKNTIILHFWVFQCRSLCSIRILLPKRVELRQKAASERRENAHRLLTADIQEIHSQIGVIDQKLKLLQSSTIPKAQQVYTMLKEYYMPEMQVFLTLQSSADLLRLKLELLDIQQERASGLADLMQNTAVKMEIVNRRLL